MEYNNSLIKTKVSTIIIEAIIPTKSTRVNNNGNHLTPTPINLESFAKYAKNLVTMQRFIK